LTSSSLREDAAAGDGDVGGREAEATELMDTCGLDMGVFLAERKEESDGCRARRPDTSGCSFGSAGKSRTPKLPRCEVETLDVEPPREWPLKEPPRSALDHWSPEGNTEDIVSMVGRRATGERVARGGGGKLNGDSRDSDVDLRE